MKKKKRTKPSSSINAFRERLANRSLKESDWEILEVLVENFPVVNRALKKKGNDEEAKAD